MKKSLSILILCITFCLILITSAQAALVPVSSIDVPYKSGYGTLYTYSSPDGLKVSSCLIDVVNTGYTTGRAKLIVDGEEVLDEYLSESGSKQLEWSGEANNIKVKFTSNSSKSGKEATVEGGSIQIAAALAGEEAEEYAQEAESAAKEAESAANSANTNANQAKNAAQDAYDKADSANSNAWDAKQNASDAKDAAQTAANKADNANTNALAAKNNASAAHSDADYIRSTQLPGISSDVNDVSSKASTAVNRSTQARNIASNNSDKLDNLDTKVASIESTVNNLASGDTTPPDIKKVEGLNQATATETSTFDVVVEATDNQDSSPVFKVKADTGSSWSSWTSVDNPATATGISGNGSHNISVKVKDSAGNIATSQLTIFKL